MRGERILIILKADHRHEMTFRWRVNDGPTTLNAGLVALWFSWGSGPVLLSSPIAL